MRPRLGCEGSDARDRRATILGFALRRRSSLFCLGLALRLLEPDREAPPAVSAHDATKRRTPREPGCFQPGRPKAVLRALCPIRPGQEKDRKLCSL